MPVPPPDSAPTLGEILRGLQAVTSQLQTLAAQQREDRDRYDLRFVPRGEWVEARRADSGFVKDVADDVSDLKTARAGDASFRRQILGAFAIAAFSAVVAAALAVVQLVLGR